MPYYPILGARRRSLYKTYKPHRRNRKQVIPSYEAVALGRRKTDMTMSGLILAGRLYDLTFRCNSIPDGVVFLA